MGYMDIHLTNVIGIVLPLYLTIKSIEKPEEGDDRQWITYWGIFLPLWFVDLLIGDYLKYLPLFYFIKLTFLIWMFLPNSNGAKTLHDRVISPSTGSLDFKRVKNIFSDIKQDAKLAGESMLESLKEVGTKMLEVRQEYEEIPKEEEPINERDVMNTEKLQMHTENISNDIKKRDNGTYELRSEENFLEAERN
jgi:receptor expression-enhancing protein 5/6